MRSRDEILRHIDLNLYIIYTGESEVDTDRNWHQARALAWALGEESRDDRWLKERLEEVKNRPEVKRAMEAISSPSRIGSISYGDAIADDRYNALAQDHKNGRDI